jgi:polar amino acid transport system substrate-binding protein
MNLGNSYLVAKDRGTGELRGVTVDLSRALAAKLGVPVTLIEYQNVGAVVDGARSGAWDIAFLAVDSARSDMDFTPAYMEIDNSLLVPASSAIRTLADIDRPGLRIAVPGRSAPDLFLTRTLKHATLVRGETVVRAFEMFRAGQADAIAAGRHSLLTLAGEAGYRALEEPLLLVPHAVAVPKGRAGVLEAVTRFVEEAKASGEVARAIARAGLRGVSVAPAAAIK